LLRRISLFSFDHCTGRLLRFLSRPQIIILNDCQTFDRTTCASHVTELDPVNRHFKSRYCSPRTLATGTFTCVFEKQNPTVSAASIVASQGLFFYYSSHQTTIGACLKVVKSPGLSMGHFFLSHSRETCACPGFLRN